MVVHWNFSGPNACNPYHPESSVREKMTAGFTVVDCLPEGAPGNPRQDVYLLRRMFICFARAAAREPLSAV